MASSAKLWAVGLALACMVQACLALEYKEVQLGGDAYVYTKDGGRYPNHFDWAGPSCPTRKHLVIAAVGDRANIEQSYATGDVLVWRLGLLDQAARDVMDGMATNRVILDMTPCSDAPPAGGWTTSRGGALTSWPCSTGMTPDLHAARASGSCGTRARAGNCSSVCTRARCGRKFGGTTPTS